MARPEEILGELLRSKKLTLSAAESCTGGRVGDKITNVPGSSDYFLGSAVTYSNQAKTALLGVKEKSLKAHGAVSEQVAEEMTLGCRKLFGSDIAVSTTGIAGPTGGSKAKPVGLVWFGVSDGKNTITEKKMFTGDREQVKEAASHHAIVLILSFVGDS
jgi:nicotinamide-nucleotide amidase